MSWRASGIIRAPFFCAAAVLMAWAAPGWAADQTTSSDSASQQDGSTGSAFGGLTIEQGLSGMQEQESASEDAEETTSSFIAPNQWEFGLSSNGELKSAPAETSSTSAAAKSSSTASRASSAAPAAAAAKTQSKTKPAPVAPRALKSVEGEHPAASSGAVESPDSPPAAPSSDTPQPSSGETSRYVK